MSCKKDLHALRKLAEAQGWSVEHRRGGHLAFRPPDIRKPVIFMGSTPSDKRAVLNLRAQLRRAGLDV